MTHKKFCLRYLALLACVIQLSACHKVVDRLLSKHNHDHMCRISGMKQALSEHEQRNAAFFYNDYGDLDSVIYDIPASGGNFFYYKYDEHHRLTGYEVHYDAPYEFYNYYHIHSYVYADDGKIIIDTARYRQAGSWTQVSYLEYDTSGRVIKETGNVIEAEGDSTVQPLTPKTYQYDERGNLTFQESPANYDDKVNFLSTRNALMFTERNYSRNNPVAATGYNIHKLPLGFGSEFWSYTFEQGLFLLGLPAEISYDCW
jgi:hypothetical protein